MTLIRLGFGLALGNSGPAGFNRGSGGAEAFFFEGAAFGFGRLGREAQLELVGFDDSFGLTADDEHAHKGYAEHQHQAVGRSAEDAQGVKREGGASEGNGRGEESDPPEERRAGATAQPEVGEERGGREQQGGLDESKEKNERCHRAAKRGRACSGAATAVALASVSIASLLAERPIH